MKKALLAAMALETMFMPMPEIYAGGFFNDTPYYPGTNENRKRKHNKLNKRRILKRKHRKATK